jgi:antitoxin VapB
METIMGLSIKNQEVETMIRTLAEKRGISMTEAIRQALQAELARETAAREAKYQALMEISRRAAALPRISDLTDDEILGYDEYGLPN